MPSRVPLQRSLNILGLLTFCGVLATPAPLLGYEDRIIAVVNKDVITQSDLDQKIQDEYKRLKAKYRGEDLARRYDQKQRETLNILIEERLQLQEAKSKGFDVTQEELNTALQRSPLLPNQTELEYRNQLLMRKVFDFEVRRNVVVEEEEMRRFYESNPTMFLKPPQYRLTQILLSAKEDYEWEPAREKARKVFAAWKPGMDLNALAAEFSLSVHRLGWVQEDELLAPLSKEIQTLKAGELSTPLETPLGFHLLMVEETAAGQAYPFDEVEREIRNLLQRQKTEEQYQHWLADLKKKAFIEVKF